MEDDREKKRAALSDQVCPKCGSKNVKIIPYWQKALDVLIHGTLAKTVKMDYQCRDCKATWEKQD